MKIKRFMMLGALLVSSVAMMVAQEMQMQLVSWTMV